MFEYLKKVLVKNPKKSYCMQMLDRSLVGLVNLTSLDGVDLSLSSAVVGHTPSSPGRLARSGAGNLLGPQPLTAAIAGASSSSDHTNVVAEGPHVGAQESSYMSVLDLRAAPIR